RLDELALRLVVAARGAVVALALQRGIGVDRLLLLFGVRILRELFARLIGLGFHRYSLPEAMHAAVRLARMGSVVMAARPPCQTAACHSVGAGRPRRHSTGAGMRKSLQGQRRCRSGRDMTRCETGVVWTAPMDLSCNDDLISAWRPCG